MWKALALIATNAKFASTVQKKKHLDFQINITNIPYAVLIVLQEIINWAHTQITVETDITLHRTKLMAEHFTIL